MLTEGHVEEHYELIRKRYIEIANGNLGYVSDALDCVLKVPNEVAVDSALPESAREKAVYAAVNSLVNDYINE